MFFNNVGELPPSYVVAPNGKIIILSYEYVRNPQINNSRESASMNGAILLPVTFL